MNDASLLLRVSVDGASHASLTIDPAQLRALLDQGLNVVEYVNGNAVLRVDLTKISDQWFDTELPVTACSFALELQDAGVQVTVAALTEGKAVEAAALTGVTLTLNGKRVFVTHNGIY